MESFKDQVAIVGAGCTKYADHFDKSGEDLLVEACAEAFTDAGVEPKDIRAAWFGGGDAGPDLSHALKLDYIPVTRVENWCSTGGDVFHNAAIAIASGIYDVVLAAGYVAHYDMKSRENAAFGPGGESRYWGEPASMSGTTPGMFAPYATRYMHHYEQTYDQLKQALGAISIKNYANGRLNPKASLHIDMDMERYLKTPPIAWPLNIHDCSCLPNGAAAAILTRPELAASFRDDYVVLQGIGMACGPKAGRMDPRQDWVHFEENVRAAASAYRQAGISDPLRELDVAILHDAFTVVEMVAYEDLRLAPRGEGGDYARTGVFNLGGELPVNTDGGLKAFGHGVGSCGLHKIYEVYKQLQGKAGERQVNNATRALTHDQGGQTGQFVSLVTVFTTRD